MTREPAPVHLLAALVLALVAGTGVGGFLLVELVHTEPTAWILVVGTFVCIYLGAVVAAVVVALYYFVHRALLRRRGRK